MALKSIAPAKKLLPIALLVLAAMPSAYAQESFSGKWKVVEVVKPGWIEPTAQPQGSPMAVGDTVDFQKGAVSASGVLACAKAEYKVTKVNQGDLFQRSISAVDSAANIASQFKIESNPRSLLVDCDSGAMFEYHEAANNRIVTLFDNLVYTLERAR